MNNERKNPTQTTERCCCRPRIQIIQSKSEREVEDILIGLLSVRIDFILNVQPSKPARLPAAFGLSFAEGKKSLRPSTSTSASNITQEQVRDDQGSSHLQMQDLFIRRLSAFH